MPADRIQTSLRRLSFLVACAGTLVLLSGCQFLDQPAKVKTGPYVSVLVGVAEEQFDLPSSVEAGSSIAYGARVGYRVHPQISIEGSWEELVESDLDLTFPPMDLGEVSGRSFAAHVKGYLVDAPLQPYALIGIGVIDAEVKDSIGLGISEEETETLFKLGGGLEAHSGEHLSFFAEGVWNRPEGDIDDFEFITIFGGVTWRF